MKHIKTGEDVAVSRRMVAIFLLMSIADYGDQLFDYQDKMWENDNGRFECKGNKWTVLWPGTGREARLVDESEFKAGCFVHSHTEGGGDLLGGQKERRRRR